VQLLGGHGDLAAGHLALRRIRLMARHPPADRTAVAGLLCVLAQGPRGMTDLARCRGVEKAALTGLADRAERRGLAERAPVPGDRRALQVTPTKAGHRSATAFPFGDAVLHRSITV
jgi:DNA-binding MarR family transcriptional regulator